VIDDLMRQLSFDEIKFDGEADFGDVAGSVFEVPNDHVVNESDTHVDAEPAFDVGRTEEHIVEHGNSEEVVKQGNGEEAVEKTSAEQVDYDVDVIDSAYETQYYVETSEDAVPDDVLEGEDIDVVNADGFNSDTCYDDETSTYMRRRLNELRKDTKEALNASS
nr:hypothetical protein [Tanacetum cinerariifolium]